MKKRKMFWMVGVVLVAALIGITQADNIALQSYGGTSLLQNMVRMAIPIGRSGICSTVIHQQSLLIRQLKGQQALLVIGGRM